MDAGGKEIPVKFKESLPEEGGQCPPSEAAPVARSEAWRFVNHNPVIDDDFKSHHARSKPCPPSVPVCKWAATSLFTKKKTAFKYLPKPRSRYRFIAKINISPTCGVSILENGHINFWRYDTFSPIALDIEAL